MQTQKGTSRLMLLLALSVFALSCLPCQTSSQIAPSPVRTVPVSTQEAENLVSTLGGELLLDSEGYFVLVVTEEGLTSYVALNMQESITDPQVLLTDGQIFLYGTLVSPIEAPVTAICSLDTVDGQVQVTVESVELDGFPIPRTFVEAFAQQIDEFITFAQRQENVEITAIEITEGEITIRGRVLS